MPISKLLDTQFRFNATLAEFLHVRIPALGLMYKVLEVQRSDEQAAIHAMGEGGRARLARDVEGVFPALAMALVNNGRGNGVLLSNHRLGLAADVALFEPLVEDVDKPAGVDNRIIGVRYLTSTVDYQPAGEVWEGMHPLARWGGRFARPDGNHFSFEWGGRA